MLDRNGGGTVGRREFKLRPEDVAALDRDGDGEVQLDLSKSEKRPRGGAQGFLARSGRRVASIP